MIKSILCLLSLAAILSQPETVNAVKENAVQITENINSENVTDDIEVNTETDAGITGVIFLGDSRTVGMQQAVADAVDENTYFVCKVGQGYSWLVSEAIPEIEKIMENNLETEQWIILTNLGVNDLHNAEKYQELYDSMLESNWNDVELYYISVNPINEAYCHTVTNQMIKDFNSVFSNKNTYIDTYSSFDNSWINGDGLHYSADGYRILYQEILDGIS